MIGTHELIKQSSKLHTDRSSVMSLWQSLAENFHIMRADFTTKRDIGSEFAGHLMSSYPILAHRELTGILSSMLRRDEWFKLGTNQDSSSVAAKRWLESATKIQRQAMYANGSGFVKATKEGDGDFVAFGQAVLSVQMNKDRSGLLYRNWHLRDVVWSENDAGQVDCIYRRWKPRAADLIKLFGKNVDPKVRLAAEKDMFATVNCLHAVVPTEMLNTTEFGDMKYVSTFIDVDNSHSMEQIGLKHKMYSVPRWQTVSGSQYAYSLAAIAALPDARLIQALTSTLLEAGEKYTNPPLLGVDGAIRSDLQVFPGGVTWVDRDYDERTGDVLRPLNQDRGGMPIGMELSADTRSQISEAFYLNKLSLPDVRQMTAYEVNERMQEFVRQTLPLFEPMEDEYNGSLCNESFDLLFAMGAFGAPGDIPRELQGASVEFQFESPIKQASDKAKGQMFREAAELLATAIQLDPGAMHDVDVSKALRDALMGVGAPATWLTDEQEAQDAKDAQNQQEAEQMKMAQQAEMMKAAG